MIHVGIAISVLPCAAEIARDPLEFVFIKLHGSANNRPISPLARNETSKRGKRGFSL